MKRVNTSYELLRLIGKALIVLSCSIVIAGCQKENSTGAAINPVGERGDGGDGGDGTQDKNSLLAKGRLWGRIVATLDKDLYNNQKDVYQKGFLEAVKGLMSVNVHPEDIGFVSGSPEANQTTGVRFLGDIPLNKDDSVKLADAVLRISIWDELGIKHGGKNGGEYAIFYPTLESAEKDGKGNRVLVFKDKFGTITLTGRLYKQNNQNRFMGAVSFANEKNYKNEAGVALVLGMFDVPYCGIFRGGTQCI